MPRRPGQSELPKPKRKTDDQDFDACPYCGETFLKGVGNRTYFTHLDACEKYDPEIAHQAWVDGVGVGRGNKRHGTPSRYEKGGCRCDLCKEAHRKKAVYYRLRKLEKARQEITRSADQQNPGHSRQ